MTALELLAELDRAIAQAAPEERPGLVVALAARLATLGAGLTAPQPNGNAPEPPDEALDAQAASTRTGMSVSWLYKNAKRLPFAAKVGRRTVFSARAIERWRAARMRH